jgi:hypothetical protein
MAPQVALVSGDNLDELVANLEAALVAARSELGVVSDGARRG